MQTEVCDAGCGDVDGAVGGTPDRAQSSSTADVHVRGGCSAAPTMASARKKTKRRAAAAKAVGGGDGSTTVDDGSTDSTVLLESWSNVEDHARSGDDVRMDDSGGAESTVGRMQVVEAVDETADLRGSGVLPTDGGVVGGSTRDQTCIVGGDKNSADRGELAGGGTKMMGAERADTEVPVSEVAPHPDPGRQYIG